MRWLVLGVWVATSGCEALRNQASRGNQRPLTPEEFGELLNDKFCDELDDCSDGNTFECDDLTSTFDVPSGCEFNADMARDCLDDPWICNRDFGTDFSFPQAPDACNFVLDCGGTIEVSPGSTSVSSP